VNSVACPTFNGIPVTAECARAALGVGEAVWSFAGVSALASAFVILMTGPVNGPYEKTVSAPDGSKVVISGMGGELGATMLVTTPTGETYQLNVVHGTNGCVIQSGASILSDGTRSSLSANDLGFLGGVLAGNGIILSSKADGYKVPVSGSGKDKSSDTPSWVKQEGSRPKIGETPSDFADRVMDAKYGKGNYGKGPGSEHSKIQKYGGRAFKNP